MSKILASLCFVLFTAVTAAKADMVFEASTVETSYPCVPPGGFGKCSRTIQLHVGEYRPGRQVVTGDILYLHGFGDTFTNHGPLFRSWTDAGFRVLAFDFPGHGKTQGKGHQVGINDFNFEGLMALATHVERVKRQDPARPLLLAGWSTGGLLAVRLVQTDGLTMAGRAPKGVILFTPGVSVRTIVGQPSFRYPLGEVTFETLTHNPDTTGLAAPSPASPGLVPIFATSLLYNSQAAQWATYPKSLPTLVFVAGEDEDRYVPSRKLRRWVNYQPGNVVGIQCRHARHWLDHELPEYGGDEVKAAAKLFAERILTENAVKGKYSGKACHRFH